MIAEKVVDGRDMFDIVSDGNLAVIDKDDGRVAALWCPCGCGVIRLDVRDGEWSMDIKDDKPTITPSVAVEPCGSHFFIRNGEIEMV